MDQRTFGQVVDRVRQQGAALFLGAGCSATAGIFLAQKFVDEVFKPTYPADWEAAKAKDYDGCMEMLDRGPRRRLIQGHVAGKPVNLAHMAIAALMKAGAVKYVITTNFDSLLIRACGLLGFEAAVFDVTAMSTENFGIHGIGMPAIFYVHGQYHGFTQYHAASDFGDEHTGILRRLVHDISEQQPWIVVGYSGRDKSVLALTSQSYAHGLFWIGYRGDSIEPEVANGFGGPRRGAHLVQDYDADSFFASLARALGCDSELRTTLGGRFPGRGLAQAARQYQQFVGAPLIPAETLKVPSAHPGLLVALPPFTSRKGAAPAGFSSPAECVAGIGSPEFRARVFNTNWGPVVAAVEHHADQLTVCWVLCTPQSSGQFEAAARLITSVAPKANCRLVDVHDGNSIVDVQQAVERCYSNAGDDEVSIAPEELIADITSGLSTISGGIVLATLDADRPIEYLTQREPLVQEGRALTTDEIAERQLIVAIRAPGAARLAELRARE